MEWFISDTHFGHNNIRKHSNRPFDTVEEMDNAIIRNWNNRVGQKDIVYHLGDFAFRNVANYLDRLNGRVHLILGNHDRIKNEPFESIGHYKRLKINGQKIILFHYPIARWDCRHYDSWHLYGHCHGTFDLSGKAHDVGVDNNNFSPVSLDEIRVIMESK